jgi:hypothetical protein
MLADTPILMNNITVSQNTLCVNATTNNTNGTITVGGANYTIPPPSNVTNEIGNQTIIVNVKPHVNYTTVCTTVINRNNTRNFTQYFVNPTTYQISNITSKALECFMSKNGSRVILSRTNSQSHIL